MSFFQNIADSIFGKKEAPAPAPELSPGDRALREMRDFSDGPAPVTREEMRGSYPGLAEFVQEQERPFFEREGEHSALKLGEMDRRVFEDGETGSELGGALIKGSARTRGGTELEVAGGTASVSAKHDADSTKLGYGYNLAEASLKKSWRGDGLPDGPEHMARFGAGLGSGFRGELHHSDADDDGIRELGFGFDAGPISVDFKSEALGGLWNRALNFFLGGDRPTHNVTPGERAAEEREKLQDSGANHLPDFNAPRAPSLMPDWSKGIGHYKEIDTPGGHYAD